MYSTEATSGERFPAWYFSWVSWIATISVPVPVPTLWKRFRAIRVNLRDHGFIMHLLLFPHISYVRSSNWRDALFNPKHNVTPATEYLAGANQYKFWYSVADRKTGLALGDGLYSVAIWDPGASGGLVKTLSALLNGGWKATLPVDN